MSSDKRMYIKNLDIEVIEYEVDDTGAMIYVSDTEESHVLNETAYYIYKLFNESKNIDDVYSAMQTEFEIDESMQKEVTDDIYQCIDLLIDKRLIKEI
ncbi:PqqD family protein [Vallitalea guaymasensis]|uniref:PqqD family protein n=1 Tax=Vallitalea guaymasensis TaxID=1185412 RepID=UPI000DE4B00D|nr:PqqD family protein [Vallitalea guaymasensis]